MLWFWGPFFGQLQWTIPLQNSRIYISRYFLKVQNLILCIGKKWWKMMSFPSSTLWGLSLKLWFITNTEWEHRDLPLKIIINMQFNWVLMISWPLCLILISMTSEIQSGTVLCSRGQNSLTELLPLKSSRSYHLQLAEKKPDNKYGYESSLWNNGNATESMSSL